MEAEAILAILKLCYDRDWVLVSSDVVDMEITDIKDVSKRNKIAEFCELAQEKVFATEATASRANELQALGFKALDSFHIALAESADVNVLLSTDDKMVKLSKRLNLNIKVKNPLSWLPEVL
jgi:hypothetical protein